MRNTAKVVLVTGGTSGIGLETAVTLARAGHAVIAVGRTKAKASAARERLEAEGVTEFTQVVEADMTDEQDVIRAVDVSGELGALVGAVAFAGGSDWLGPLVATPLADWRRVIDGNVTSAFLTVKHVGRVLARSGGGSIVLVSSISGSDAHRWLGPYAVGKHAVEALCRLAAAELGSSNVRVNAVRPGLIATAPVRHILDDPTALRLFLDQQSLDRIGQPEDVVAATTWLLSEASRFVTGEVIAIDGGASARRGPDMSHFARSLYSDDELAGRINRDGTSNWLNR